MQEKIMMQERKIIVDNDNDNVLQVKKLCEIVYMESFGCKTKTYCCEGKEYLIKKCLSHVEESLPNEKFFKINESFIINADYLKKIKVSTNKNAVLHGGIELHIARQKYNELLKFLKMKYNIW